MQYFEVENYAKMSRMAANIISAQVITNHNSVLGLATGATPEGIYRQLIDWYNKGDIDFSGVSSVNLDEYMGLEENNHNSYRYYMNNNFFNHININKSRTFIPNGTATDTESECEKFDNLIQSLGGIDLQLLGIGEDGHIGFNEPDDCFYKSTHVVKLDRSTVEANARFFDNISEVPQYALTMGMVSIMQAKKILLVACGSKKKNILDKAFRGPITPKIPASILQLHKDITVIYSLKSDGE